MFSREDNFVKVIDSCGKPAIVNHGKTIAEVRQEEGACNGRIVKRKSEGRALCENWLKYVELASEKN